MMQYEDVNTSNIVGKKIEFTKFITMLGKVAKNGILHNLHVTNCIVYDIPQGFPVFIYPTEKKFLGFVVYKTPTFFMGFAASNCIITYNNFKVKLKAQEVAKRSTKKRV